MKLTHQGVRDLNSPRNGRTRHTHNYAPATRYTTGDFGEDVAYSVLQCVLCGHVKDD